MLVLELRYDNMSCYAVFAICHIYVKIFSPKTNQLNFCFGICKSKPIDLIIMYFVKNPLTHYAQL